MRPKVWMCLLGHRWEGVPFSHTAGGVTEERCPCCHLEAPDVRSPAAVPGTVVRVVVPPREVVVAEAAKGGGG